MDDAMHGANMPATTGELRTVETALRVELQSTKIELRAEIQSTKQELSNRLDGHEHRLGRIEDNLHRLNVGYAQLKGEFWDFRIEFRQAMEAQSNLLISRMDRILNVVEDIKLNWAFHEDRISRLEAKRP